MPRNEQIVPYYLHPHVETYINDNTIYSDEAASIDDGVRSINVFTSPKGRDNVIIPMTKLSEYIEEYGAPNYKLHGQPGYMPHAALSTLKAKCYCMRIMPDDATYSNLIILIKVKVDKTVPATPKLVIKFNALVQSGLKKKSDFVALCESLAQPDPDADGFITYPLMGGYVLGKGSYGDQFRLRVSNALASDNENNWKNYNLEILSTENGLISKEVFTGSIFEDALTQGVTNYLVDLVNDHDEGSKKINIHLFPATLQEIYALYVKEVNPTTTLTQGTIDILLGKTKKGKSIPDITIDTTSADARAIDVLEGLPFSGGDDGSFKVNPAAPEIRDSIIEAYYVKAFNGQLDKSILSKKRTPAELIMDANYPISVKRAIIQLLISTKRYDAYGFIDAGLLNTTDEAIAWGNSMIDLEDRIFSKEFQHFTIKDPYSGKNMIVTTTYFLARKLPIHFKEHGNHIPFTGKDYALLTGHVKNTLAPVVDADDDDVMEELYKLRVNYMTCIAENTFIRAVQSTSQSANSDLSEEHNMHVLLEIKRKIEDYVASLAYNFSDKAERKKFTEKADRIIAPYRGIKIATGTVYFDMSKWEATRSILHCYLAIQYRTINKRGIVEIDINKRDGTE